MQLELSPGRSPPQGAILSLLAVVKLPRGPDGGFDERTWLRRQGVHVVLHVDEWHVVGRRGGLGGAPTGCGPGSAAPRHPVSTGERRAVLEGVVLGDDAGLDDELKTSFRRSGLYHLLAVSGANVVLLAAGMLALARACGLPRGWAHVAAIAAILALRARGRAAAVGDPGGRLRHRGLGRVARLARARPVAHPAARGRRPARAGARTRSSIPASSSRSPRSPRSSSSSGRRCRCSRATRCRASSAAIVAVSVACSAATAPILWLQFGQVPLLGVVANALVEPVVGALLGLALVTAVVAPVAPPLAAALAWLNGWIAAYIGRLRPARRRRPVRPGDRARRRGCGRLRPRVRRLCLVAMADELQAGLSDRGQRPPEGRPGRRPAARALRRRRRRAARRADDDRATTRSPPATRWGSSARAHA